MPEHEKAPEQDTTDSEKKHTESKTSEKPTEEPTTPPPEPQRPAGKQDQQKKKDKKGKKPGQDEGAPKKKEHDENFNYIVRLVNTDINGEHNIVQGLTQIKGIGRHMAVLISDIAEVDRKLKFGNLTEPQIEKIREAVENVDQYAPSWMLNYQKDYYSGEDMHLISTDVAQRLREDINMMKMIRSYRGVRHEMGLKVRGQRTSSNGRKGLALGVSKRREAPAATGKKEEPAKEKK
ncbi:MAG: 30S ribosomal protein S13 [Candidatus Thermoplasmatota archaeon]|nr:30S ribosomal protein S13 [Candidatus Thermoplasmatota archaeon]